MTEHPFNPVRAISEEIAGVVDIQKTLVHRARQLETQLGEVEGELNSVRKLIGFATIELERKREVMRRLKEEEEKKS